MEEDYQKALEHIFAYGYRCCAFKHNICGGLPWIPNVMLDFTDPLPPELFVNPGYPPAPKAVESQGYRGTFGRSGEGSGRGCRCRGIGLTSFLISVFVILGDFYKGCHFTTNMRINSCNPWQFLVHLNGITRYHQDMSHV